MRYALVGIMCALLAAGGVLYVSQSRSSTQSPQTQTQGDTVAVSLGDVTVIAAVADTADERAQGLSGRRTLNETDGMLFVFESDDRHSFWMKDMLMPIDIIWLSSDKQVVHIVANASPESYPNTFSPDDNARYVLEVAAGWAARHQVTIGSRATF